jgi:hypothetical protein
MLVIVGLIVPLLAVIVAGHTHLSARLSSEGLCRPGHGDGQTDMGESQRRLQALAKPLNSSITLGTKEIS